MNLLAGLGGPMLEVCFFVVVAVLLVYYLLQRVEAFYRAVDSTLLDWTERLFPGLRRRLALSHIRNWIRRERTDHAAALARQRGLEGECVEAAAQIRGPLEAARCAKTLGRDRDATRWFEEAFENARKRADEADAISIAVEGGLHHRAAAYYEKAGGGPSLRHAGEHFEKAGEFIEAGRCFEAAGEPYRAFTVLSRAGLRPQVEALLARTNDLTTRREAQAWLEAYPA